MILLVLGANSDVAFAIAGKYAGAEGAHLVLASRDVESLERKRTDIEIRHQVQVKTMYFDALDFASHKAFYEGLDPRPDAVVVAFGYLGDQSRAQKDFGEARRVLETNFAGCVSILEIIAADFESRGRGTIIGLSSVAGERGRQSNYMYGAAKSALTAYLSGLRNRLHKSGVRVVTVLPGFVKTKMTEGMKLPGILCATPEEVAADVYSACRKGADVVYTKWFWRWIMMVIRNLPEALFKRLQL